MLTKMVNGIEVEMSAEEEAEIRAEWEANDPKNLPPPPPTLEEKVDALLAAHADPAIRALAKAEVA